MTDPVPPPVLPPFLEAALAAAASAAVVLLVGSWPWRTVHPKRTSAAWVLGVGSGFYVGCWVLGVAPKWPPSEDQDRFLLLLFPAAIVAELVATLPGGVRHLAWLFRAAVVAGAARVLLHNSSYIADLSGPGSRAWTPEETARVLGGLAVALGVSWAAVGRLTRQPQGRSVPIVVGLVCAGAAAVVMLSGYASGGQLGLPLAGALIGATVASLALTDPPDTAGPIGLGIVGLFAVLIVGRFFGSLTTLNATLLFVAPLIGWLFELPPRCRWLARIALTGVPVAIVLVLAAQTFFRDYAGPSSTTPEQTPTPANNEPSLQDYLDFRK